MCMGSDLFSSSRSTTMACLAYLASLLAAACILAKADIVVYTDNALASPWQDWSWSSTINYDATDLFEGTSSISVDSGDWAALSLYNPTPFPTAAGLEFDIAVRHHILCSARSMCNDFGLFRETHPMCRLRYKTRRTTLNRQQSLFRHLVRLSMRITSHIFSSISPALLRMASLLYVIAFILRPTFHSTRITQGNGTWDRITFQAGGNGASVSVKSGMIEQCRY